MRLLALSIIFLALSASAYADLEIRKISKEAYNTGEKIGIYYEITNTFDQDVAFIIRDFNEIDGRGYIIECLEVLMPAQMSGVLDFSQNIDFNLIAHRRGEHIFPPANITFRDPRLNLIDTVQSNPVTIKVSGDDIAVEKRIDVYNFCEEDQQKRQQEMQEEKEGQPSKEEKEQELMQKMQEQAMKQKELQEQYESQSEIQKKLSQSQQSMQQDSGSVRDALNREMQRNQEAESQFQEKLDDLLLEEMNRMEEEGYQLKDRDIIARDNQTGDFSYTFERDGEIAEIEGSMQDGIITDMQNSREIKEHEDYQALRNSLEDKGYRPIEEPRMTEQGFTQQFQNDKGEAGEISGNLDSMQAMIENREIIDRIMENDMEYNSILKEKIMEKFNETPYDKMQISEFPGENPRLETPVTRKEIPFNYTTGELLKNPKRSKNLLWLLIIPAAALLLLLRRKEKEDEIETPKKDYRKEALEMIMLAEKSFKEKPKDSYGLLGYAIRFYYSYHLGIEKELSNIKLYRALGERGLDIGKTREALDLASLVEFAKYETNRKDFEKIVSLAKKIIR